jgi:hypothetical protein
MGKSNQEKFDLAEHLLKEGKPYRFIQDALIAKFGSGMSNTTLKRLLKEQNKIYQLEERNKQLEHELALFKKMYFELLNATKKSLASRAKGIPPTTPLTNSGPILCTYCGSILPPNARFCASCGHSLSEKESGFEKTQEM